MAEALSRIAFPWSTCLGPKNWTASTLRSGCPPPPGGPTSPFLDCLARHSVSNKTPPKSGVSWYAGEHPSPHKRFSRAIRLFFLAQRGVSRAACAARVPDPASHGSFSLRLSPFFPDKGFSDVLPPIGAGFRAGGPSSSSLRGGRPYSLQRSPAALNHSSQIGIDFFFFQPIAINASSPPGARGKFPLVRRFFASP